MQAGETSKVDSRSSAESLDLIWGAQNIARLIGACRGYFTERVREERTTRFENRRIQHCDGASDSMGFPHFAQCSQSLPVFPKLTRSLGFWCCFPQVMMAMERSHLQLGDVTMVAEKSADCTWQLIRLIDALATWHAREAGHGTPYPC